MTSLCCTSKSSYFLKHHMGEMQLNHDKQDWVGSTHMHAWDLSHPGECIVSCVCIIVGSSSMTRLNFSESMIRVIVLLVRKGTVKKPVDANEFPVMSK